MMRTLYCLLAVLPMLLLPPATPAPAPLRENACTWTPACARLWAPELELDSEQAISPYDHLIREAAAGIGWDWRLLAALIYHESRFHNEAQSVHGARGLMQILSERYTEEELLNPENNLSIGTRYLYRLERQYEAATPLDSIQFALAAYNLGEGKVGRLIERTRERGLDATRWSNVAQSLPEGHHTVAYVDKILDKYFEYRKLYR